MALSQATLFQRVRDILGDTPWATPFTASVTAAATTVAVSDGTLWDVGSIGEWQDTGEQFYTRSVSVNNLTVFRGYNGTTATAHDGTITPIVIWKTPAFTFKRIQDAAEMVVLTLWPYAWKKSTTTITISTATTNWYDVGSTFIDPIQASQVGTESPPNIYLYGSSNLGIGTAGPVPMPPTGFKRILPVQFGINLPTSQVASGIGVSFPQGFFNLTNTIQVDFRALLTATVSAGSYSDLSEGMSAEVVAYGAAARLVRASEVPRVTTTAISMGDSSVTPTSRTRAGVDLMQDFIRLRKMYYEQLWKTIPPMSVWRRG